LSTGIASKQHSVGAVTRVSASILLFLVVLLSSAEPGENGRPQRAQNGSKAAIQLQKIVAYGRTLELIGRTDPGSTLRINDEPVEVSGNGSFKHFTRAFPASTRTAHLVLKSTDLSGKVCILKAKHDFFTGAGER
jgi:hypothetical protein